MESGNPGSFFMQRRAVDETLSCKAVILFIEYSSYDYRLTLKNSFSLFDAFSTYSGTQ